MKRRSWVARAAFFLICIGLIGLALAAWTSIRHPHRTDRPLTLPDMKTVCDAATLMHQRGLPEQAAQASRLLSQGIWRAATPRDPYLKGAEKAGDTPFAYTLSSGKHPSAIVLAPRFFTDATPTGQAALMIHEMGHYNAYVRTGKSDEYDGYKAEYDTHAKLGLGEADGLVYFSMLDGVVEYVVPRAPGYKSRPDIKKFIAESSGS